MKNIIKWSLIVLILMPLLALGDYIIYSSVFGRAFPLYFYLVVSCFEVFIFLVGYKSALKDVDRIRKKEEI